MKDPSERTKVVVRRLPPAHPQAALMEQIDVRFAGRYKWARFCPGRSSQKNQRHSRAYIDFKRLEDAVEFAEFFDGHVFVNEKGTQFKAIVEYAPSQRIPKAWSKKDGREGTIFKDPEYLEFLEILAKPVEHLPSAEIQLERKEAERAAGVKESPVVTPLMDFVRQKRAARSVSQRPPTNGKLSRRASGGSSPSSSSPSSKRASEKRRGQTSMYVLRDGTKTGSGKDKGTYILVPRREDQQPSENSVVVASASAAEALEDGTVTGSNASVETGKRRFMLLKGKEREGSNQNLTTSARNSPGSTASRQNQRQDASGRIIRSILLKKDARQNQSYLAGSQSEQQTQMVSLERDKRPPRPPNTRSSQSSSISSLASISDSDGKRSLEDKVAVNDQHGLTSINEQHDRHTKNKDRPDRGVWTPLRRSDGSHANDDTLSSSSVPEQVLSDSMEAVSISQQVSGLKVGDDDRGGHGPRVGRGTNSMAVYETPSTHGDKADVPIASRSAESKSLGAGRSNLSYIENGSHRHVGRRGPPHGLKDLDGPQNFSEGKPSKRGGATGYGSHERQIWVQKSGSGS